MKFRGWGRHENFCVGGHGEKVTRGVGLIEEGSGEENVTKNRQLKSAIGERKTGNRASSKRGFHGGTSKKERKLVEE